MAWPSHYNWYILWPTCSATQLRECWCEIMCRLTATLKPNENQCGYKKTGKHGCKRLLLNNYCYVLNID